MYVIGPEQLIGLVD